MKKISVNELPNPQVDHPEHYQKSGMECIDVAETFNFNLGNVIKYVWRAGNKSGNPTIQDLQKASWYLTREIERLTK